MTFTHRLLMIIIAVLLWILADVAAGPMGYHARDAVTHYGYSLFGLIFMVVATFPWKTR